MLRHKQQLAEILPGLQLRQLLARIVPPAWRGRFLNGLFRRFGRGRFCCLFRLFPVFGIRSLQAHVDRLAFRLLQDQQPLLRPIAKRAAHVAFRLLQTVRKIAQLQLLPPGQAQKQQVRLDELPVGSRHVPVYEYIRYRRYSRRP